MFSNRRVWESSFFRRFLLVTDVTYCATGGIMKNLCTRLLLAHWTKKKEEKKNIGVWRSLRMAFVVWHHHFQSCHRHHPRPWPGPYLPPPLHRPSKHNKTKRHKRGWDLHFTVYCVSDILVRDLCFTHHSLQWFPSIVSTASHQHRNERKKITLSPPSSMSSSSIGSPLLSSSSSASISLPFPLFENLPTNRNMIKRRGKKRSHKPRSGVKKMKKFRDKYNEWVKSSFWLVVAF